MVSSMMRRREWEREVFFPSERQDRQIDRQSGSDVVRSLKSLCSLSLSLASSVGQFVADRDGRPPMLSVRGRGRVSETTVMMYRTVQ